MLKIKICSSKTSVESQRTTLHYNSEDTTLHKRRCDNLQSKTTLSIHFSFRYQQHVTLVCLTIILHFSSFSTSDGRDTMFKQHTAPPFHIVTYSSFTITFHLTGRSFASGVKRVVRAHKYQYNSSITCVQVSGINF